MRTQFGMLTLLVLGLSIFTLDAQANIFVKDQRRLVPLDLPELKEVRAIGVVDQPGIGGGNAWLVGNCHIVTNYHVAFMKERNEVTGEVKTIRGRVGHSIDFYIGRDSASPSGFKSKTSARVVDFGNYVRNDFHGMTGDWAILKLDDCLGQQYGILEMKRPTKKEPMPTGSLVTAAYTPTSIKQAGILIEKDCKARDFGPVDGLVGVDCAFEDGMCGSPIFEVQPNGKLLVVGMPQNRFGRTDQILSAYSSDRRNQMLYASAFYAAVDKVLATEGVQATAVVPPRPVAGIRR